MRIRSFLVLVILVLGVAQGCNRKKKGPGYLTLPTAVTNVR
jgi:hypothetical protein